MAAEENDCVSYGCKCVRLAALPTTQKTAITSSNSPMIAMREKEYGDARVTPSPQESRSRQPPTNSESSRPRPGVSPFAWAGFAHSV